MTGKRFIEILFATPVEYRGKKIGDVGHLEDLGGHELWLARSQGKSVRKKVLLKDYDLRFQKI